MDFTPLFAYLWQALRRPILLGSLILCFLAIGVGTLWLSRSASDWWQDLLLNAGVNLIFVGAIDLLILSVIARGLLETRTDIAPDEPTALDFQRVPFDQLLEITAALDKMAGRELWCDQHGVVHLDAAEHEDLPTSFVQQVSDAKRPAP
ncbi:hypothetical protein [Nonomuraea sp. NPDC050202]|uniref:hypothetical protein n=1 Tax=Nonomuraea sp. NPDC050202 TaxID=3155035 RepID=UPI0033FDC09A